MVIEIFPFTGFGTAFADLDHDGQVDLLVANGRVTRSKSEQGAVTTFWQQYEEPNHIYRRNGDRFDFLVSPQDPFLSTTRVSRALCCGDIDNDGDLDALVVNIAGQAQLFLNESKKQGHFLEVRLTEPELGGRDAYGAKIVAVAGEKRWTRWVAPGASYLASHDPRVHFGLGAARVERLEVRWPNGEWEFFPMAGGQDQQLVLEHGKGQRL